MILHPKQKEIVSSPARFKVIRAGRKAGKSAMEIENLCFKAMVSASKLNLSKTEFQTGRKVLYIAPTQDQARKIVWEALKSRLAGIGKPNEQMLIMKVPNEDGGETSILIGGWENRENYRGLADVVHITFDEVDTLREFFISWKEIFRPMFLDTKGSANFIGTPKKESANLRRLEKEAKAPEWECFHFTSKDNPFIPESELNDIEKEYQNDMVSYRQEILAEYVDNTGSLFRYDCLLDVFTNTVDKSTDNYLIVDVAGEGSDKTVFSVWEGLLETKRDEFQGLNTEGIILKIKDYAIAHRIPYPHIAVDAIGEGASVASNSQLNGIIGYKSSYSAIKTDMDIVRVPNMGYLPNAPILTTDYKNLRSQCVFTLADMVNNHKIASRVSDRQKDVIVEELMCYQDVSSGDGKRMATQKEDVKAQIARSPDNSDTWIMRMYFVIKERMMPDTQERSNVVDKMINQFKRNQNSADLNSAR